MRQQPAPSPTTPSIQASPDAAPPAASPSSAPLAVVTGSSGFIGSHLVRRLLEAGYRVRRLVRPRSVSHTGGEPAADVETHTVRWADPDCLVRSPALDGADVVFHLAGITKATSLDQFRRANVLPTQHLLRALAARGDTLSRCVLVSSQAAAGPAPSLDRPVTEDDPPHPIEAYGASKLEAEDAARPLMDRLPISIVRPCSVYGPGDTDFLPLFRMARCGILLYPGTASQYISLLHVDDVVDGLLAAAVAPSTAGTTLFLSSSQPVRWDELGTAIATALGLRAWKRLGWELDLPLPLVRAAAPIGELWTRLTGRDSLVNRHKIALAGPRYWVCSAERAARLTGFRQRRTLPEGLQGTYCWYVRAGWLAGGGRAAADTDSSATHDH